MKAERSNEWLKGGTSLYCLKQRDDFDEESRKVVLCGRTWIIKTRSDQVFYQGGTRIRLNVFIKMSCLPFERSGNNGQTG